MGIENRPAIADEKTELGHWESDTVIGANHIGVLVTHVDKTSKFLVAGLAKDKTAREINRVTEELFQAIPGEKRKTFTCDNGKEFSGHQELSRKLDVDIYFATEVLNLVTQLYITSSNVPINSRRGRSCRILSIQWM